MNVTYLGTGASDDGKRWVDVDATFSDSYATGGDALPLTSLPIREVHRVLVHPGTTGRSVNVDLGAVRNPKVALYATGSQAANGSNQSSIVTRLRLYGA